MKQRRIIKQGFFFGFLALLSIWAALSISHFMNTLTRIERDSINESLAATAKSNAAQVRFVMERYTNTLSTIAQSIAQFSDIKSPEALAFLNQIAQRDGYARLAIDFIDGTVYTSDGFAMTDLPLEYIPQIQAGKPFILDIVDAYADNVPLVSVLIPLRDQAGDYTAALRASMTAQKMSEIFNQSFLSNNGYYHLIDSNGRYIADGNSPDALLMEMAFFDALDALSFADGHSSEQIKASFFSHQEGFSKYSVDGQQRYAYYLPVGVNNWVLMMVTPSEILEARTVLHQNNSMLLCIQIAIIFLCVLGYVYVAQTRAKNQALLHERCFEILAEQTGRSIFEWDISDRSANCKTIFGHSVLTQGESQTLLRSECVHPEDREIFDSIFARLSLGETVHDARFRLLDASGSYRWSSLSGLVLKDARGRALRAIGSLESIDKQVRTEYDLRQKAEKDALTNLYNKATTEYLIKDALQARGDGEAHAALLIIDVDNFKNINDTFGHLYGDIVLASLAENLRQIFRADDIIGRIGGDEFFVFLQNIKSMQVLQNKAEEIRKRFHNVYLENDVEIQISASIGIALCPEHGNDFDTLYQHTDIALYAAKANGKNAFCFYDGSDSMGYHASRTAIDTQGVQQKSFTENRIEYIFKLLYGSGDPISSLQSALELLAAHFHFTRSYIFEFDKDYAFAKASFAWHGVKNRPSSDFRKPLRISDYDFYTKPLWEDDIYILPDSHALPAGPARAHCQVNEIRSMIQCAIKERGRLVGVVRFDDCSSPRAFSPEEVDELSTLCHLLSTFLIKHRGSERELRARTAMEQVLNNSEQFAYVVSPESYRVLYENKSVAVAAGSSAIGKHCYESYRAANEPCADCPMRQLSGDLPRDCAKVPCTVLGRPMLSEATWIDWSEGQRVCLITVNDATGEKAELAH